MTEEMVSQFRSRKSCVKAERVGDFSQPETID